MKIYIEFNNTNELLALNDMLVRAIASGKSSFDINIETDGLTVGIPESDLCDCYHSGYCWGTKEMDICDCGGRKSRCTFYKKGF